MKDKLKFIRTELQDKVKEIKDPMQELSKDDKLKLTLENTLIDLNKEYTEPPTYLSIKDLSNWFVPVFTPANISAITGKAKAKKSFVQSMFISAMTKNGIIGNTIKASLPNERRNVILLDTEQSIYHVSKVANRISRLIKYKPDNLFIYSLRGLDAKLIIDIINYIVDAIENIGIIFIDQIADLAKSINNEEEAIKIVRNLEQISKDKGIHICCVIHQNKADNYASGWLGSQIMKKSETVISVEKDSKDKRISFVKADLTRGVEFADFAIKIQSDGLPCILNEEIETYNPDSYLEPDTDAPF